MADEPATLPLSTEFRLGLDLVSQLPAHIRSPLRGRPWPTYWPEQSVYASAAPNLAMYVRGWQHGDQLATPELRAAMLSNGVLPNASQPETSFRIGHVNYTAFRLIGRPDDIIVRPTERDANFGGLRGRDRWLQQRTGIRRLLSCLTVPKGHWPTTWRSTLHSAGTLMTLSSRHCLISGG